MFRHFGWYHPVDNYPKLSGLIILLWLLAWSNHLKFCAALCECCQESIHDFSRLLNIFELEVFLTMRDAVSVPAASGLRKWVLLVLFLSVT